MHDTHQGFDAFQRCSRQDAVTQIHDMSLRIDTPEQIRRRRFRECGAVKQYRRVDVALHGATGVARLHICDVHAPIDRQYFRWKTRIGFH